MTDPVDPFSDDLFWEPHDAQWEQLWPLGDAVQTYVDQRSEPMTGPEVVTFDAYRRPELRLDTDDLIEHAEERLYVDFAFRCDDEYQSSDAVKAAAAAFASAVCEDYAAQVRLCCVPADGVPSVTVVIGTDGDFSMEADDHPRAILAVWMKPRRVRTC